MADRNNGDPPRVAWLLVTGFSFVVLYLAASLVIIPSNEAPEFNFRDEQGSVTALSAIFLAMGGAFAFVSFFHSSLLQPRIFWFGLSAALGFLAMDELLEFHERVGRYLDRQQLFDMAAAFGGWNNIVVIAYGCVALAVLMFFLPTALKYPRFLELFGTAFLFYVIYIFIDLTQEPPTMTSVVLQESAKLLCSVMLAVTQFVGVLCVFRESRIGDLKQ